MIFSFTQLSDFFKKSIFIISFIVIAFSAKAQFPNTEVFLMEYEIDGDSLFFNNPIYLSDFNRTGYNNQPFFFNNNELYLTSNMYSDEQTEVIKLDLKGNRLYRVTNTVESDFSPTLMPDDRFFSCVRIERDGKDQSLWQYPINRTSPGLRLVDDLENVGYHVWISDNEVALFLVDDPIKLVIANTKSGARRTMLENIGRCMRLTENGELIVVHKLNEESWYIKSYDIQNRSFKLITETLPGKEDFELLSDGSIIMTSGSKVWKYQDRGVNSAWQLVDDFKDLGLNNLSRMAISSDKIAFVNTKN